MIFVRSFLVGIATLVITASAIYALAIIVPLILEFIPRHDGGGFTYLTGPFPLWALLAPALAIFAAGFYWNFRRTRRLGSAR